MAKKVRFPLEMENGVEVRSMEELRANFSLSRVIEYLKNGKLVTWLKDRYANDVAEALEKIDIGDNQVAKKVCEVFGVEFDEAAQEDLEKAAERSERVEQLKKFADDAEYVKYIDNVAFDQDELYDLLDEDQTTIYLCGERFLIPLAQSGITYIGVNNPIVVIDSKVEVDWLAKGIMLKAVTFDEKYQKVVEKVKSQSTGKKEPVENPYSKYQPNSILNFMLSPAYKVASAKCFDRVSKCLGEVKYDIDGNIREIRQKLIDENIVGIATNYLERL